MIQENKQLNWSEEDDEMRDKILNSLIDAKNIKYADYNVMYNWLILIKERLEERQ